MSHWDDITEPDARTPFELMLDELRELRGELNRRLDAIEETTRRAARLAQETAASHARHRTFDHARLEARVAALEARSASTNGAADAE